MTAHIFLAVALAVTAAVTAFAATDAFARRRYGLAAFGAAVTGSNIALCVAFALRLSGAE